MSRKGKTDHTRSCQSFSFILITEYIHLKTSYIDKLIVCENDSSGTYSLFMVTYCLEKIFKGINIARKRV